MPENCMMAVRLARPAKAIARQSALLILLCLLAMPPTFAQLRSLDVSQYLHTSWTAQDGYFRGIGSPMAETASGYIWILTSTGLLRFDGVRFVEWTPPNGEPLPGKPPAARRLGFISRVYAVAWGAAVNAAAGIFVATNPSSSFFYLLTAAHGLHILGGLTALVYVDVEALRLKLGPGKRTAVDVSAVFWHFVDGLWIYLMALFLVWG